MHAVEPDTATALPRTLHVEQHGPVAVLRLSRPGKRNALNDAAINGIERFFGEPPPGTRAIVLRRGADGDPRSRTGAAGSRLGGLGFKLSHGRPITSTRWRPSARA